MQVNGLSLTWNLLSAGRENSQKQALHILNSLALNDYSNGFIFVSFFLFSCCHFAVWGSVASHTLLKNVSEPVLKQMPAAASDIVTSLFGERCLPFVWVTSYFDRNEDVFSSQPLQITIQCSRADNSYQQSGLISQSTKCNCVCVKKAEYYKWAYIPLSIV